MPARVERPRSDVSVAPPAKDKYKYKKISEITAIEKDVNVYGVVAEIRRGADDPDKHAVLRVIDETCKEDQTFRAHIFFKKDHVKPRFAVGDIVRFYRMKIEEFQEEMDGRIFSLRNLVTFPQKGTGKEGAFSAAESFNFDDYDKRRLVQLRKWIESTKKPIVSIISNVSEEGKYVLECQVVKVDRIADSMLILTATDCDQTDKKEVHIIAEDPPDQLEMIPLNTNVTLHYVRVSATHVPTEDRTVFVYEMQGQSSTFNLLRSFQADASALASQSSEMQHSAEENTANEILKKILLFTSQTVEFKDTVMSTCMKEAAALIDVDFGRSQSPHFGRSDLSLMQTLGEIAGNSQLHSNMSTSTPVSNAPKENTEWHVLPSTSKSSYLSYDLLMNTQNASTSDKCEVVPQRKIGDEQQSHKTNRQEIVKRLKNLLDPTIEEYKDSLRHNENKGSDHQASSSNSQLPTMQGPIRDSAEENVAAQNLSLRKSVTIENEGEAEHTSQPASDEVNNSRHDMHLVKYLEEALLTSEFEFASKGFNVDTYSQFSKNPQSCRSGVSSVSVPQREALSGCESEGVPSSEVDGGSPVGFAVLNSCESEAYNVPCERWSLASASGQESRMSNNSRGRHCGLDSSVCNRELENIGSRISEIENVAQKTQTTENSLNGNEEENMDVVDDQEEINVVDDQEEMNVVDDQEEINVVDDQEEMVVVNDEMENSASSDDGRHFASDISDLPDLIEASISHVKQQEVLVETAYVLKAWLTKIQPPIDLTQKFPRSDNIIGSCPSCLKHYLFHAMNYEIKTFCKNCHEQGKKVLLNLSYMFRLHLVDENDDSIVVSLFGPNAVEFLGCTVNSFLGDEYMFNRTNQVVSRLILRDNHLPPAERGLMLKLIISPIISSKGPEYIMHSTHLNQQRASDRNVFHR